MLGRIRHRGMHTHGGIRMGRTERDGDSASPAARSPERRPRYCDLVSHRESSGTQLAGWRCGPAHAMESTQPTVLARRNEAHDGRRGARVSVCVTWRIAVTLNAPKPRARRERTRRYGDALAAPSHDLPTRGRGRVSGPHGRPASDSGCRCPPASPHAERGACPAPVARSIPAPSALRVRVGAARRAVEVRPNDAAPGVCDAEGATQRRRGAGVACGGAGVAAGWRGGRLAWREHLRIPCHRAAQLSLGFIIAISLRSTRQSGRSERQ